MLGVILFASGAAALRSGQHLFGYDENFTLQRLPVTGSSTQFSDLKSTENILQLREVNATSASAVILQSMRLYGRQPTSRLTNATVPLNNVEDGQVFIASITVGGQEFDVIIDSGSSDPWLATDGFTCYDPDSGEAVDESDCGFGTTYDPSQSPTYASIPDLNFNVTYADHEVMNGKMAYETVTLGGITVTQQEFGVVDSASWYGDGYSSGLVGFAYRGLTSAYRGSDPKADKSGNTIPYNPLFANMYTQQDIPPVFSVLIDRQASGAGLLGLGGIPSGVAFAPSLASTPIVPAIINAGTGQPVYEFYAVEVAGFALAASPTAQFNPLNTTNALKTPLVGAGTQVIVDTGTSLVYIPDDVVAALAALYSPAATWDESRAAYDVDCDADTPVFGIAIGRKIFYVNGQDMVVRVSTTDCIMGIQPSLGGLSILGGTWLKNVLAVFDIGAGQMRFAARQFYSLYNASVEQDT